MTLTELKSREPEFKPDVVVVSGDVGWKGVKQDYQQAGEWLNKLLDTLDLSSDCVLVCAGNQDVDRNRSISFYPRTPNDADTRLAVDSYILKNALTQPFEAFVSFCEEYGIPPLLLGNETFCLMGQREVAGSGLRFVVLNSAWFCHSDEDQHHLWIGLPQLEVMNANAQIVDRDSYDDVRSELRRRRITRVTPEPADEQGHRKRSGPHGGRPVSYDRNLYKGRNVVERAFNLLIQWRGDEGSSSSATRYGKHPVYYRGAVVLAAILTWL